MFRFQSEVLYSPQVRRNDTKLLIVLSNGDVMTASPSLRNVHRALQVPGMRHGKKQQHLFTHP